MEDDDDIGIVLMAWIITNILKEFFKGVYILMKGEVTE